MFQVASSRRFGVFEVNLPARELRKHGTHVKLSGHSFEILAMLLERPGEIVTREQLRSHLWPADTFVDFEHGLNTAVRKLRATLGDSPENSRYIETVPRVGYRFVAPVEPLPAVAPVVTRPSVFEGEAEPRQRQVAAAKPPVRKRTLFVLSGGALAVLTFVVVAAFAPLPVPRVTRISRITDSGKVEPWADPVTDGSRIYFLERAGGHWNQVQSSTAGGTSQPVASSLSGNVRVLDVSPDLSQLLVGTFLMRDSEMAIWTMPIQGGAPRRLGEIMARTALWDPNGKHILYSRGSNFFLCDMDGQNSRELTSPPGLIEWPAWSPDGKTLRFTLLNVGTGSQSLWQVAADGTHLHPLFPDGDKDCCGRWTPDGKYFLFLSARDGKGNLWAVRKSGGLLFWKTPRPVKLTSGPNEFTGLPIASRDGKRVFAYETNPESQVMRLDPKRGTLSVVPGTENRTAVWCPTGEWVAYADTEYRIWRSRSDGSQLLQLTHPPLLALDPRWSPDSTQILFEGLPPAGQLYLISRDGGEPLSLLTSGMLQEKARWHPNGREIIFEGAPRDAAGVLGDSALYTVELSTRKISKLPGSEGLEQGVYSPDAKYILGVTEEYHKLLVFDVARQTWTELATGNLIRAPIWAPDSASLYYQDLLSENEPIYRYWLKTKKREQIFDFREQLKAGFFRAALYGSGPEDSLLFVLSRGYADLYALDIDFP